MYLSIYKGTVQNSEMMGTLVPIYIAFSRCKFMIEKPKEHGISRSRSHKPVQHM
jgi:hypothetical protein